MVNNNSNNNIISIIITENSPLLDCGVMRKMRVVIVDKIVSSSWLAKHDITCAMPPLPIMYSLFSLSVYQK